MLSFCDMKPYTVQFPENRNGLLYLTDHVNLLPHAHQHEELELNVVFSGTLTYAVESSRYDLQEGSCLWLFPSQPHMIIAASDQVQMLVAVFKKGLIEQLDLSSWAGELARSTVSQVSCRTLSPENLERIRELYEQIIGGPQAAVYADTGLRWLLVSAWKAYGEAEDASSTGMHAALIRALQLMRAHPDYSTDRLADLIHISRSHLSRLFHEQTGTCLQDYRNRIRLERFFVLYERERNCLHAALDAGFGSYAQFYRVCKKNLGISPRTYIQQHYGACRNT